MAGSLYSFNKSFIFNFYFVVVVLFYLIVVVQPTCFIYVNWKCEWMQEQEFKGNQRKALDFIINVVKYNKKKKRNRIIQIKDRWTFQLRVLFKKECEEKKK